jgi:hypothetical protein
MTKTPAVLTDLEITIAAIQKHLDSADEVYVGGVMRMPVPPIVCRDGAEFSIQAGEHAYCSPRSNQGPWTSVEVMSLGDCVATNWDDSGDVAGWVPIEDVAKEIIQRGFLALPLV